jgi:threonyl-tRNA synthetase
MIEEAEKRDHRKLGRELDLFHLQDEAQGSVFWHPKGFTIYNQMEAYIRRRVNANGYNEVKTPQLMSSKFWEASGHWGKYRENMFVVPDEVPGTEEEGPVLSGEGDLMALKPMNCPGAHPDLQPGHQELPRPAAAHGRIRLLPPQRGAWRAARAAARAPDDAGRRPHLLHRRADPGRDRAFRAPALFGVWAHGLRQRRHQAGDAAGEVRRHDRAVGLAEKALGDALRATGYDFVIAEGEGAFYAPKLEFHLKDAIGRSWQVGTLQLDYVLPERLGATYVAEDGSRKYAVMLHRAILGSLERFIGMMIESYAGKLPTWLAPMQVVVATIVSEADDYAASLVERLKAEGVRPSSTSATRRSTTRCASTHCRRCRCCSWSASARRRRAPCPCAASAARARR